MSKTHVRLDEVSATLPSAFYYDRAHHERELRQIWHKEWLLVGRADQVAAVGDYQVVEVGDQSVIITRGGIAGCGPFTIPADTAARFFARNRMETFAGGESCVPTMHGPIHWKGN